VAQHQQGEIEQWLAALIGEILELSPGEIEMTARFDRYGLDSVAVVSVTEGLSQYLERELDATVMYDFPTIQKLARHLAVAGK